MRGSHGASRTSILETGRDVATSVIDSLSLFLSLSLALALAFSRSSGAVKARKRLVSESFHQVPMGIDDIHVFLYVVRLNY